MFRKKESRFPEPSPPDPKAELCPTFLVKGDTIVDVVYVPWIDNGDGTWDLSGVTKVTTSGVVDRIVYELPIGCYQSYTYASEGADVTFYPGGGDASASACNEKPRFAEQEVVEFCEVSADERVA